MEKIMDHLKTLNHILHSLEKTKFQKFWKMEDCQNYEKSYKAVQLGQQKRIVVFDKNQENIFSYQIFSQNTNTENPIEKQTLDYIQKNLNLANTLNSLEKITIFIKALHTNYQIKDNPSFHERILNLFLKKENLNTQEKNFPNFIEITLEQDNANYNTQNIESLPITKYKLCQYLKDDPIFLQIPEITRLCYNYNALIEDPKNCALLIYDKTKTSPEISPLINVFHKNWQNADQQTFKKFLFSSLEKLKPSYPKTTILRICNKSIKNWSPIKNTNLFIGILKRDHNKESHLILKDYAIYNEKDQITIRDIVLSEQNLFKNIF